MMTSEEVYSHIYGKMQKMKDDGATYDEMGKITGYNASHICQLLKSGNPARTGGMRLRSVLRLCPELFGISTTAQAQAPDHIHAVVGAEWQARILRKIATLDIPADALGKVMQAIVSEEA